MTVINAWVGATGPSTATVVARTTATSVRLAVANNSGLVNPVFFGPVTPDAQDRMSIQATGLLAATPYWWALEEDSVIDTTFPGRFRTHPTLGVAASFTFGASGDAGADPDTPGVGAVLDANRLSNHAVFDTIRTKALTEGWLFFWHLGDLTYYDLGSGVVGTGTVAEYRRMYDDVLLQPRQHQLYREIATGYVWDDHDYGPNDSDGTYVNKGNAQQVYRERAPHYTLGEVDAIYHEFSVGRIQFIISDTRSDRSPNINPDGPFKTMLGEAQKTWMRGVLEASTAEFLIWVLPSQWHFPFPGAGDTYALFRTEQAELIGMFVDTGWRHRMMIVSADVHCNAIDTGGRSPGGIPVFQFSSLDATPTGSGHNQYDTGPTSAARNQYGTVTVIDDGQTIVITGRGWTGSTLWREHTIVHGGIPGLQPGDRIDLINTPDNVSVDDVSLLVLGWTETIGSHRRKITYNCVPYAPFDVGHFENAAGDATKYDTSGSELAEALDTTETGVDVATTIKPFWTTDDAETPFDIYVGGERMTITDIGAVISGVQTFTVTRSVNGVIKTHAIGTNVQLWPTHRLIYTLGG